MMTDDVSPEPKLSVSDVKVGELSVLFLRTNEKRLIAFCRRMLFNTFFVFFAFFVILAT